MCINIQSLPAKFNEFTDLISQLSSANCCPDIICLQEIWQLKDPDMFNIAGYTFFSLLRNSNVQGGGVGIYVKNIFNCRVLKEYSTFIDKVVETIFVEVTTPKKKKLIVGSVYRPNSKYVALSEKTQFNLFLDNLSNVLADLAEKELDSFILGDFNLDVLKYNSNEFVSEYIDNVFSHGFLQLVNKPTRCTSNSATLIDHVLTNKLLESYETCILISRLSDHFPIVTFIPLDKSPNSPLYSFSRDFSEHNLIQFKNNLSNISWNNTMDSEDTQESYDNFSKLFLDLYEMHFPLSKKKFNRNLHKVDIPATKKCTCKNCSQKSFHRKL